MTVLLTKHFKKQLRKLKKKYPNVKTDFFNKMDSIDLANEISIGRSLYKIRIRSSDLQKGKSGGFRSYIYAYKRGVFLVPACIYVKSQKENISGSQLNYHFHKAVYELFRYLEGVR